MIHIILILIKTAKNANYSKSELEDMVLISFFELILELTILIALL